MTSPETICQFADTIVDEYSITKKKIRVDFFKYFQSEDVDRKTINEYSSNHIHLVTDILEGIKFYPKHIHTLINQNLKNLKYFLIDLFLMLKNIKTLRKLFVARKRKNLNRW